MQLDNKERGFSFLGEGKLDMRMDQSRGITAKEIVNRWPEKDLGKLFRECGEEPQWKKAARVIVTARKKKMIESTNELAKMLCDTLKRARRKLHPATLIFQALRIAVNQELGSIESGVKEALRALKPGGKIGVLSFHRLEDRIVKNLMKDMSTKRSNLEPIIQILTKKPLVPTLKERRDNPRARSAKLRIGMRCVRAPLS